MIIYIVISIYPTPLDEIVYSRQKPEDVKTSLIVLKHITISDTFVYLTNYIQERTHTWQLAAPFHFLSMLINIKKLNS